MHLHLLLMSLAATMAGLKRNHHHHGSSSTNRALTVLILMAFASSLATVFLSSPSISRSFAAFESMNFMGGGLDDNAKNKQRRTTMFIPSGAPRRSVSDVITWMLSGRDRDAETQHAALARLDDSPMTPGLEFPPGSLKMDHAHALRHCFADPTVYGNHLKERGDGSRVRVSYSERHNLTYVMIPKSGSSTARHMLQKEFQAIERSISLQPHVYANDDGGEGGGEGGRRMAVITFVRDPLSRFYSQYDESYVRTAPWQKKQNPYYVDPDTKAQDAPHPFPYLYEGLNSYDDYEDVYCPIETRKSRKECKQEKTREDGTLASRFERFVGDYDGRTPFDVHMTLQATMLSSSDGLPLHVTQIYNTTDSEGGWKRIARQFLGENATLGGGVDDGGEVIAGRSYPRRFDSDLVSVETRRRICELVLIDYCCLNLPLPDVCKGRHYKGQEDEASNRDLFCILDRQGRIQPGMFPGKKSEGLR